MLMEFPRITLANMDPSWRTAALVDLETTGFRPTYDEVIEASATLFAFSRADWSVMGVLDQYTGLQMTDVEISPMASQVHGITMDELDGESLDLDRMRSILRRAECIVAHNAAFDRAFLRQLIPGIETKPWYCSMRGIDWSGYGFDTRRLSYLLDAHNINQAREHRADCDVMSVLQLLATRGAAGRFYLQDLMEGLKLSETKGKHIKPPRADTGPLAGEIVVVTGTMVHWTREAIEDLIETLGGNSNGSVSRKTTLVVAGPGAGSKLVKARELGIRVMNEDEFISLIGGKPITA